MKQILDMEVTSNEALHSSYSLLKLIPAYGRSLPPMQPGQFVQVRIDDSPATYLRRPISVNFVDERSGELWLLVRKAGEGTAHLMARRPGDVVNLILPLGNGFSCPPERARRTLLIGGGVGVAPLLYLGYRMKAAGFTPEFLLGARSKADLLELEKFSEIGTVYVSTDDGSLGEPGVVTSHSVLKSGGIDMIYCCGPMPMMKAVARAAREIGAACEVSLENVMACGVGACLCCVEKTVKGNVCVCTEGPVFNIDKLTW
ncbi:MAG: dihydroorotate dehydrogenase electron transfer subunit [Muribaculaceae bacterium]|nr:dihydroorotate dehydrogenase electron transfer subunit [Muribaculaceae bacterium]